MNTKFNIELPFFPGFYESWALDSDSEYYAIKDEIEYMHENYEGFECDDNDFELDYEVYKKDVCEAFIDAWKDIAPDVVKSISKEYDLSSPRFYNHSTDKLYVEVELDDNWLDVFKQFISDNKEWFAERIKKDWTSYDGFWSFMGNTVDEWLENLENEDDRYISTMLGYIAYKNNNDVIVDLMYGTMDNIYIGSYLIRTEDAEKRLKEWQEAEYERTHQPGWDMTNQTEIEFPEE